LLEEDELISSCMRLAKRNPVHIGVLISARSLVARLRSFMTDGQEEVVLCLVAERWVVVYTHMGWCDSMTEWLSWYNLLWSARRTTIRLAQIMEWLQWNPKLVDDAVAADRRKRVCCMLTAVVQEERPLDDRMRMSMLYACAMLVYHYVLYGIGMDECDRGGQERYAERYTERLDRDLHEAAAMLERACRRQERLVQQRVHGRFCGS